MVRLHNVKSVVLIVVLCAIILFGSFLTWAQTKSEKPVSVLVLGSISRMMVGAYMVDETVAQKLGEENANIVYMPYDDVTWDIICNPYTFVNYEEDPLLDWPQHINNARVKAWVRALKSMGLSEESILKLTDNLHKESK